MNHLDTDMMSQTRNFTGKKLRNGTYTSDIQFLLQHISNPLYI